VEKKSVNEIDGLISVAIALELQDKNMKEFGSEKNRIMQWIKCLSIIGLTVVFFSALTACTAPASNAPITTLPEGEGNMIHQKVTLTSKEADGYIIPLKQVKVVFVVTDKGMVGCGAFDVMALDSFTIPAAKVKSATGNPIATIDDLMNGVVKEANKEAVKLGITTGMSGKEALDRL
jgi:uncharacterized protein YunC (DUF1805 family)